MTREELTKEIVKRIKDIKELYYSVYPEGDYSYFTLKKGEVEAIKMQMDELGEDNE